MCNSFIKILLKVLGIKYRKGTCPSTASTFYWSLIQNRVIDVKWTLVNKHNLVDNLIARVVFANTRRLFYDIGSDGLSDTVRFLLHNMTNYNFTILQNIL